MSQGKVRGGTQTNVNTVPWWQGWFRRDKNQVKPCPVRKLPKEPRGSTSKRGK